MTQYWLVALGGSIGAVARFHVASRFPVGEGWPLATWLVNVFGSLAIGLLFVLFDRGLISSDARALLIVGFLGAFTTFSTFSLELLQLMQRGAWLEALGYALGSVASCLLGVAAGVWLMRQLV